MSNEKQIWHQITPEHYKCYNSFAEAARELNLNKDSISNVFIRNKQGPYAPVRLKGHVFYKVDPHYHPVVKAEKDHIIGEPLLRGNPKHHIGVWR